jgi:hypothetical protein
VLAELAADPAGARALGEAAARDLPERFAPGALLERVQALYDDLLETSA